MQKPIQHSDEQFRDPRWSPAFVSDFALSCLLALALAVACSDSASGPRQPLGADSEAAKAHLIENEVSVSAAETFAPQPVKSKPPRMKRRARAAPKFGVHPHTLTTARADSDIEEWSVIVLPSPLVAVAAGLRNAIEDQAVIDAVDDYRLVGSGDATVPLEDFIDHFPDSRWSPSVLLNLAKISYRTGRFSKTLEFYKKCWELTRDAHDPVSVRIANLAIAEYAKMNARVGRLDELDQVLGAVANRDFEGDARIKLDAAIEARWKMINEPGLAFRCGPYALTSIAPILKPSSQTRVHDFLQSVKSPRSGFSLSQVWEQADSLGMKLVAAYRSRGSPIVVPSVVHWKVGHFGALTRKQDGRYTLKDPTFGNQTWISQETIDEESSGYFLVPDGRLPQGWRTVEPAEGDSVYGKGHSGNADEDDTGPEDPATPSDCEGGDGEGLAMARFNIHLMLASLRVFDTPIRYSPATGPPVQVDVTYSQREASQPLSASFTSFSPQWVSNWISYLEDDPAFPAGDITLRQRNGGGETHINYNPATMRWEVQAQTGAYLRRLGPNAYEKIFPDG